VVAAVRPSSLMRVFSDPIGSPDPGQGQVLVKALATRGPTKALRAHAANCLTVDAYVSVSVPDRATKGKPDSGASFQ
jgi:hypothetical protein